MNDNKIVIKSLLSSLVSRIVLMFLIVISFLIPLIATLFAIIVLELKPIIIISYIIFWSCGYFFLKLYLSNKFGTEILTLRTDRISYRADYKMFSGNIREIKAEGIEIKIIKADNENLGTLKLTNKTAIIETVIKAPLKELIETRNKINKYYANTPV